MVIIIVSGYSYACNNPLVEVAAVVTVILFFFFFFGLSILYFYYTVKINKIKKSKSNLLANQQ